MKIDRLMGIVVYLLKNGRTSAQKLAEVFEVSTRTIVRDFESLDQAGIPIQSFCGAVGGYQLLESYVLDKQIATNDEYGWIITALQGLASAYSNRSLYQILQKVSSIEGGRPPKVAVDFGVAVEDTVIQQMLSLLEDAIQKEQTVCFRYENSNGDRKEIQAEPVQLQFKWYNWYLVAYIEKHQDYCMFKLVRMEELRLAGVPNTRKHDLSEIRQKEEPPGIKVKLYGKAVVKSKCREYLHGEVIREYENGDFEFSFTVPERESFWYGVLLSLGNKVTVLEPNHLRERIMQTCREIEELYEAIPLQ